LRIVDYPRAGKQGIRRFVPSWRLLLGLGATGVLGVAALFGVVYAVVDVPEPNDQALEQTSVVYFSDGRTEIGRFGESNRIAVSLDKVPVHVRDAVLAAEDRSFYSNKGVSPTGIARAFYKNLRSDSTQGGSTITQQYVKNVYLTRERTLSRKLKEVVISVKVANQDSKEKILEDYLNTIYWGRGAYGVQTASQAYFRKDVSKLTVTEAAYLAGIIQSPSRFDAQKNLEGAERRWNYVLDGMVSTGKLTSTERAKVTFPEVAGPQTRNRLGGPRGYLVDVVKDELLRNGIEEAEIDTGGLRIVTTFERKAQLAAEKAVKGNFPKENAKGVHAGLTAVRPGTGAIVAMYGGPDYVKAPGQNAALAQIQAGSTFKPFTLAAALDEGISLSSRFAGNSPLDLPGTDKDVNNEFDQDYGSSVDLRYGIAESINTAFVDLTMELGPKTVREAVVQSGIPTDAPGLEANAVITLGTASVNTVEMANAYATFAAQGVRAEAPYAVAEVRQSNGEVAYRAAPQKERAWDKAVANNVTEALVGVVEDGTGREAQGADRPVAGKTGTAEDLTAWFVGYAPQLSAAVSFYKGDGTESLDRVGDMETFFGGGYPTEIWTAFMKAALDGVEEKEFPEAEDIGKPVNPRPTYDGDDGGRESEPEVSNEQPSRRPTARPTREAPTVAPTRTPAPQPTRTPRPPAPQPTVPTQPPNPQPTPTAAVPPDGEGGEGDAMRGGPTAAARP
jgi:membrane peptidoglycan carboxypeptidase